MKTAAQYTPERPHGWTQSRPFEAARQAPRAETEEVEDA